MQAAERRRREPGCWPQAAGAASAVQRFKQDAGGHLWLAAVVIARRSLPAPWRAGVREQLVVLKTGNLS